jgi:N-acetylglucosaminyldiphosphoundecaprenol N-acetyl-beta-D-mannosaminyltransferase
MKTYILNVPVDNVTQAEALERLLGLLGQPGHHLLLTPNPEMVMTAQGDPEFMEIFHQADLVVPDGIGVVLASRFNAVKIKERVAGCDLIQALLAALPAPATVYLLGGKPGVCEQAAANIHARFPRARVCGFHHGYFTQEEEGEILRALGEQRPDILLAGLGFPRQEKWLHAHRALPVRLSAAVGGTLDILAGTATRAPAAFRALGLEWLYRLARQPARAGRMLQLPLFALKVLEHKILKKDHAT